MVAWPPACADPFAAVVDEDTRICDLVRDLPSDQGLWLDYYVTGTAVTPDAAIAHAPRGGDLVEIVPAGQNRFVSCNSSLTLLWLCRLQAIFPKLRSMRPLGWSWAPAQSKLCSCALESEHMQLARECDIQPPDLIICRCASAFGSLAVRGTPVSRCVGTHCAHLRVELQFLDPTPRPRARVSVDA